MTKKNKYDDFQEWLDYLSTVEMVLIKSVSLEKDIITLQTDKRYWKFPLNHPEFMASVVVAVSDYLFSVNGLTNAKTQKH